MKNHQFLEINDYLNFIQLPMEVKSPDFIIYNYDEVQQESWIDLAAYRQHFFEISLEITKGCSFMIDQFSYSPEGDRVSFISPHRLQSVEADVSYQYTFKGFTIFFKAEFIGAEFTNSKFLRDYPFFSHLNSPFISLSDTETELFADIFMKINYEHKNYGVLSKEIIKNYLNILLLFGKRNFSGNTGALKTLSRDQEIYHEFEMLVHQHFLELDSVKAYADKIHISPKHLSETIKNISGQHALHFIHQAQLNYAKALLLQTNQTVTQVAQELNFENPEYFSVFFKRLTGKTPVQFRTS